MSWSSEAIKAGIVPLKPVDEMNEDEIHAFISSVEADDMGFDGPEYVPEEVE